MVNQEASEVDPKWDLRQFLGRSQVSFMIDVFLVRDFNKILPQTLKEYDKMAAKKIKNKFEKLDRKGKREYHEVMSKLIHGTKITTIKFKDQKVDTLFVHIVIPSMIRRNLHTYVREMGVVYIVAKFEDFMSTILTAVFSHKPDLMKFSQKSISYEELFNHNTVESLRKMIIEKEVRTLINENIDDIKEYFVARFSFDLSQEKDWDEFKEIFYRRNVIIHNNGYPNDLYRKRTGYEGPNQRLDVDDDYLNKAVDLFTKYSEMLKDFFVEKFGGQVNSSTTRRR